MTRAVVLVLSDLHGGHKFGLCPRDVVLYDETPDGDLVPYTPELTAVQEMLLKLVQERIIPEAVRLAGDDPLYFFHLGDPIHGHKHPEQVISTRLADQIEIAVGNFEMILPQLPTLQAARLIVGTGAHEFGEGSATIMIAKRLADKHREMDIRPLYHGLATIAGCTIDYSHHGPGKGRRVWLQGNETRYYLRDICMREVMAGNVPPDLVLRGHTHVLVTEVINLELLGGMFESRIIVCPPLCGMSDYARQATRSAGGVSVGALLIEIVNGNPRPPVFVSESFDIRTRENFL